MFFIYIVLREAIISYIKYYIDFLYNKFIVWRQLKEKLNIIYDISISIIANI